MIGHFKMPSTVTSKFNLQPPKQKRDVSDAHAILNPLVSFSITLASPLQYIKYVKSTLTLQNIACD